MVVQLGAEVALQEDVVHLLVVEFPDGSQRRQNAFACAGEMHKAVAALTDICSVYMKAL